MSNTSNSTLSIDLDNRIALDIPLLIEDGIAVLGASRTGKSNTLAVLIEGCLDRGLPLAIIDYEGEYFSLKERYPIPVIGASEHADITLPAEAGAIVAEFSITQGIPVILDVSGYSEFDMFQFVGSFLDALFTGASSVRKPYLLIVDEAQEFIPQGSVTSITPILTRIAKRGRKRGLGLAISSQRPSDVDKKVLTQMQLLFLHKVVYPTDLNIYKSIIPPGGKTVEEQVAALARGQAIVRHASEFTVVQIRKRLTFHVGATPEFEQRALPELKKINIGVLEKLRTVATAGTARSGSLVMQDKRVAEMTRLLAEKDAEIQHLQDQIAKMLSVADSLVAETVKPDDDIYRSPGQIKLEDKKFGYLLNDLMALRKVQRKILRYLVEREGQVFTVRQIAKGLQLSETTILKHGSFIDLIQLDLVSVDGGKNSGKYKAVATDTFKQRFAGLDAQALRERLLLHLLKYEVRK